MSDTHDDNFSSPSSASKDAKNGGCDVSPAAVLRYLDNDLEGQELEDFHSHLNSCANCQAHLEKERALSKLLYRSRPLYPAPAALRARINEAAAQISSSTPESGDRLAQRIFRTLPAIAHWLPGLRLLAPAVLAIALCLAFVPNIVRNARAASYVDAAVAEHRSYLDGSLVVGIQSSSSERVTNWLSGKVPFDFRLPAGDSSVEGKTAYWLTGASVVNYKGNPAVLVMYETEKEKITLLAVSSKTAVVAGGDEVRFGKLTFHYHAFSGFRVITWNNHGLSYALVSSVLGPARASCLVCHQSMTDRSSFNTNRP
jgi:anti-sigma factor RsiW